MKRAVFAHRAACPAPLSERRRRGAALQSGHYSDVHRRGAAEIHRDAADHPGEFVRQRRGACLAARRAFAQDLKDRWDDTEVAGRGPGHRVFVHLNQWRQAAAALEMLDERVLRKVEQAAE